MPHATLELSIGSDLAELASDALFECGAGAVEERGTRRKTRLLVYGADEAALGELSFALPRALAERGISPEAYALQVKVDASSDWETRYLAHLRAVELAPGFWLRPTHDQQPIAEGRVLSYEPAVAFGDGGHATTRLSARAVIAYCSEHPEARVLDFGSGTGVLALLALLAGARSALGVDIDPRSVSAARRNAQLNGLSDRAEFLLAGEAQAGEFDWAIANVEEPALLGNAARIAALSGPRAGLAVTGFLSERIDTVLSAFTALGFEPAGTSELEGWALISLRRSAA